MSPLSVLFSVVFAGIAVSYGWGMRGYIIGGEKGALLPGALLGFSISLFCCNTVLIEYLPFFCAVGALSVFFGGIEPYGQTMRYILQSDKAPYKGHLAFGVTGIFIKGALWFGIGAEMLAVLTGAIGGIYKQNELIIAIALFPVLSKLGVLIFNSPFNRKKGKFPKIYFSFTSREEWGGNLLIFIELIVLAALHKDVFTLGAAAVGFVFGGIGFLGGLLFYAAVTRKKNEKTLFEKLNKNGYIDGWKIMEHFFGAVAGAGVMFYFCTCSDYIKTLVTCKTNSFTLDANTDKALALISFVLLMLTSLQYPIKAILKKHGKKANIHIIEEIERPFWSTVPLIFVFLGSIKTAYLAAFITITYALTEKCITEWFTKLNNRLPLYLCFGIFFAGCCIYFAVSNYFSPLTLAFIYTFCYTLPTLSHTYMYQFKEYKASKKSFGKYFLSEITVTSNFVVLSLIVFTVTAIYCKV